MPRLLVPGKTESRPLLIKPLPPGFGHQAPLITGRGNAKPQTYLLEFGFEPAEHLLKGTKLFPRGGEIIKNGAQGWRQLYFLRKHFKLGHGLCRTLVQLSTWPELLPDVEVQLDLQIAPLVVMAFHLDCSTLVETDIKCGSAEIESIWTCCVDLNDLLEHDLWFPSQHHPPSRSGPAPPPTTAGKLQATWVARLKPRVPSAREHKCAPARRKGDAAILTTQYHRRKSTVLGSIVRYLCESAESSPFYTAGLPGLL